MARPPGTIIRPPSQLALNSLSQQQQSRLRNGSVEERRNTLASLDPDKRRLVLAAAPPQMLEGLPEDLQQEAAKARQAEQEELQKERRKQMPPLNELLTQEQIRAARTGTVEEKLALFNSFDPQKREQVMRALGPQPFSDLPELRREAMIVTQP